jgi:hypothetical protein
VPGSVLYTNTGDDGSLDLTLILKRTNFQTAPPGEIAYHSLRRARIVEHLFRDIFFEG